MRVFLLRSIDPWEVDDNGEPLWWSAAYGYASLAYATVFTERALELRGEWIQLEEVWND